MGAIRYAGSEAHAPECQCWDCVTIKRNRRLTSQKLQALLKKRFEEEGIERRANEYRDQIHIYQPNTQQDRTERMHQGVSGLYSYRETIHLDQAYDMISLPDTETELC